MRDLLNLIEAAQRVAPPRPAIDLATLKAEVQGVANLFAREPFAIKFDRSIAQTMISQAKQKVQIERADAEFANITVADVLEDTMAKVWSQMRDQIPFGQVRSDAEHEEHAPLGYHDRNAERFGSDDEGSVVEASAFLRGLHGQVAAANMLANFDIVNVVEVKEAIMILRQFRDVYDDAYFDQDGGEQPPLLESMTIGIGLLIPVLMLRCSI